MATLSVWRFDTAEGADPSIKLTMLQIGDSFGPPDWFPKEHPALPPIVALPPAVVPALPPLLEPLVAAPALPPFVLPALFCEPPLLSPAPVDLPALELEPPLPPAFEPPVGSGFSIHT